MSTCPHKHTKYQPTDEEWCCPKCGATAQEGFIIYESINDMDYIECELLHLEDFLICEKCGFETSGKAFAAFIVKKNNLITCPMCKGKGMVNKDFAPDHTAEVERLTAERDAAAAELTAMRQRAESAEKERDKWVKTSFQDAYIMDKIVDDRDAAVARAERAEIVVEVSRRVLEDGELDMDANKGMACVGTVLLHKLHDAIAAYTLAQGEKGE